MITLIGLITLSLIGVSPSGKAQPCMLGLAVNLPVGGGVKELTDSILEERKMGCDMMTTSTAWSDLEPTPGDFKLDKLSNDLAGQGLLGFTPVLTLKTIDTNRRALPADLATELWDSPKMLKREVALLEALAKRLPKGMGAVMLGNEVDGYLNTHPQEADGYIRFLENGRRAIKSIRPELLVGVTTMFTGMTRQRDLIVRLHKGMDIVSMTYYPLFEDFSVMPVTDVQKHFDQMTRLAGKKLFIQEAGFPASSLLASSDELQAVFVNALFNAMDREGERLYGVCYFLSVDFSDKLVSSFTGYYGLNSDHFKAMLSTLGLKRQDGTPRLAWAEFKRRAAAR